MSIFNGVYAQRISNLIIKSQPTVTVAKTTLTPQFFGFVDGNEFSIIGSKVLEVSAIPVKQWLEDELYPSLIESYDCKDGNLEAEPIVVVGLNISSYKASISYYE